VRRLSALLVRICRHCQVERRSSGWYVVDLNSTNGTRVRGALIRESALECGDEIGVSRRVTLRFMITVAAPGGALDLDQAQAERWYHRSLSTVPISLRYQLTSTAGVSFILR
jgi:pSer/pThr/pTyr-binding forkhead associated (FHA) protein